MKVAASSHTVQRALSVHAAIGLLAGAALYLVSLTGALSVFNDEWQRIEQRGVPEMASIEPAAVQRAVEAMLASEKGKPKTTHLFVQMPHPELPRAIVTTDSQTQLLAPDGTLAGARENGWSSFLIALHYTLNIPGLIGITIVGILGVMMLALSLSGVVALPRIFRDAFRLRARDKSGIGLADWHNRLSVWSLPFSIAIALTGALIGLATVTAFALAAASYDGKIEAVYAPVFGGEGKPDAKPGPMPAVAAALDDLRRRQPDLPIGFVTIHDPLTRGQHIQLMVEPGHRLIFGEYHDYDAQGRFVGTAGLSDGALGQQAAASTYRVHFGDFGGLPVKIAYAIFGLALTAISATGVYIWLGKRRRKGLVEPRLRAAWSGIVWGAPLALAATLVARFAIGNAAPFIAIFWIGLVATTLAFTLSAHARVATGRRVLAMPGGRG